ncbi:mapk-regulated corepressor-interacting protein 1 isoform X2 [Tupaia chinensis]|uniref:mapk-regulated corepressor-interacting protein 1 isoform X2 n=1 Tax=Tupaia chinensis TaxID=246437 RepID=UPI0003C90524|nr:mapk-regulated corepressor-interacting protein 1 isoform X2 [Tupaia chinensis]
MTFSLGLELRVAAWRSPRRWGEWLTGASASLEPTWGLFAVLHLSALLRLKPRPIPVLGLAFQRPTGRHSGVPGPDAPAMTSSPVSRVVYNGKRNSSPRSPPSCSEIFTPAHEENVRFIYEAWQGVERDLRSQLAGSERGLVEEYVEKVPNPSLKTFKPIDLSDLRRRSVQDAKKS